MRGTAGPAPIIYTVWLVPQNSCQLFQPPFISSFHFTQKLVIKLHGCLLPFFGHSCAFFCVKMGVYFFQLSLILLEKGRLTISAIEGGAI